MQNTSDSVLRVQPGMLIGDSTVALPSQSIGPRQIKTLHLPDDLDAAGQSLFSGSEIGGITLSVQEGAASALNSSGWVEDEGLGFSTMLSFHDPSMARSQELLGTQIPFGEQPSLGASFTSLLLLRNIADHPVS